MKNKIFNFLIVCLIFCNLNANAEDFVIESSEIKVLDKGNVTQATGEVKITSNDGVEITGRKLIYNKKKSILKIFGNVILNDKKNNIITEGEEYIYLRNEEKILAVGESTSNIKNTYYLKGSDLVYERKNNGLYLF